jgi:predicted RNA-binding Zn-ribbon protein involved in translation (DUF1610 family)
MAPRARTSTATRKRPASKTPSPKTATKRARPKTTRTKTRAATSRAARSSAFVCPECGRTFGRAAALGAHRRVHGIAGSAAQAASRAGKARKASNSRAARSTRRTASASTTGPGRARRTAPSANGVNRDGLLRSLFPNGIPANEDAIRSVNRWLDEAERLARLK